MGCEKADSRLRSGSGYEFVPTDAQESDHLRIALVRAGHALPVSAVSGTWHEPDVVFISGEHVRNALDGSERSLAAEVISLAFGSEQGELRQA